jgi:hypothetical protein
MGEEFNYMEIPEPDFCAWEILRHLCRFPWGELPFAELLLYNLRHVQEHAAQLRMFLGQQVGKSAKWASRAME